MFDCESIEPGRSIPFGLTRAVRRFVESTQRESQAGTPTSLRDWTRKLLKTGAGKA